MEAISVLDTENLAVARNKKKRENLAKASAVGSVARKTLADISNFDRQNQDAKPQSNFSVSDKEYINKLHQENMALVKLLTDRNKIIELSAIELQKLRINYQKVKQQNLQLAQANSQMLVELNSGKDKLKALQHELGCKNGLLKARKLDIKEKVNTVRCQNHANEVGTINQDEIRDCSQEDEEAKGYNRPYKSKKKRKTTVKSLEPPTTVNPVQAQEKVDKTRPCSRRQRTRFRTGEQEQAEDLSGIGNDALQLNMIEPIQDNMVDKKRFSSRRQSARLKSQEQVEGSIEDPFQIDDAKFSVSLHGNVMLERESCPTSSLSPQKCDPETPYTDPGSEGQDSSRSSFRPKRQAVEKVQSYKEIPLNVKMRRAI